MLRISRRAFLLGSALLLLAGAKPVKPPKPPRRPPASFPASLPFSLGT